MKFVPKFLLVVFFCFASFSAQSAQPQATIVGQVITKSDNRPVPGLVVSLVHPFLGRSVPTYSDNLGRFSFSGIPQNQDPYYIEVYWGNELIFRKSVHVGRNHVSVPTIYL